MSVSVSFSEFQTKLSYLSPQDVARIKSAFILAKDAHLNQYRVSGEPYFCHPIAVTGILADLKLDAETLMAGLLHDVVEDTEVTHEDIVQAFGTVVADIVKGVTKISNVQYASAVKCESENYRKMFLSMSKDIRVIIVKLADRLHNMRTVQVMPAYKRKRMAHETIDVYSPIAKRLGMQTVSIELDELGFAALYPVRHMILLSHLYKISSGQTEVLAHLENDIRAKARKLGIQVVDISTREKQLYGIYRKMQRQKSFNDLMDVYALRVCVKDVSECYAMIGIVHGMYMPKAQSFKDYIASPKRNGYQSLHTVLYGPHGTPIEIQVRTEDMHVMATQGVAAHWLYKTGQTEFNCRKHEAWFDQLAKANTMCSDGASFIDLVKDTISAPEIYVLTPKGKIREMKAGATALDFAYQIHTDIGHRGIYAIVDRERVPLNQVLKSGQTVEVITQDTPNPQAEWLNFVVSPRARQAIRSVLREQELCSQDDMGFKLLSYEFEKQGMAHLANRRMTDDLLAHAGMHIPEVYGQLGRGEVLPQVVVDACQVDYVLHKNTAKAKPVLVEGKPGIETFAPCCHPVPGDEISAVFLPNEGLHVHRAICRVITTSEAEHIPVVWGNVQDHMFTCVCAIAVKEGGKGIVGCLSMLADMKVRVLGFRMSMQNGLYHYYLTIQIRSLDHMDVALRSLSQLKVVSYAKREFK